MPYITEREHKELLWKINTQDETIERLEKRLTEALKRVRRLDLELREHDRVGNTVDMEFDD